MNYIFTAIAPNITFTNCYHHSQTVEATEKEATTLKWYEFSQGKRFVCEGCGQPFTAQGGSFAREALAKLSPDRGDKNEPNRNAQTE